MIGHLVQSRSGVLAILRSLLWLFVLLSAGAAFARTSFTTAYTKSQVYSAALRHLRVDLGYEVYEKDADAAYLLFHYVSRGAEKANSHGSIEIVPQKQGSRVIIRLEKLPSYYEEVLRESLLSKLQGDYGTPPPSSPPKEQKPPPREGRD